MTIKETHLVPAQKEAIRLSDYAVDIFVSIKSKSALKKALKKELIWVNNEIGTSGKHILGGETISLKEPIKKTPIAKIELPVIFEDEYIAVIHKPAGIIVSGNKHKTIEHALPHNLQKSNLPDALEWPQPAHRLDFPTSGLLLVGKTQKAIMALNKCFKNKEIQKTYRAIVIGEIPSSGQINTPIEGKECFTSYQKEKGKSINSPKFGELHLITLSPTTGRKHQLRIHLSSIGNPILGDDKYGKEGLILSKKGLFLQASSLTFSHPFTQEALFFSLPLARKFERIFEARKIIE
ncbi:MAG: RNA pseudouridine synthase [Bacteroidetes bacterium 4572_77]|nr:MAG: RNA pseudouridine synthase [Bacteroidetes bacterium 4572_77]